MDDPAKFRALIEAADLLEYDEVFERLARGELAEAEVAILRDSPDPETQRLYALFRPLDATARQRFDDAVARQQPATPAPAAAPRRIVNKPRRWLWQGGAMLAAAAALLVFLLPKGRTPDEVMIYSQARSVAEADGGTTSYLGAGNTPETDIALHAGSCWPLELGVAATGQLPKAIKAYFAKNNTAVLWRVNWQPRNDGRLGPPERCANLPALASGTWDFILLSGSTIPNLTPQEAVAACRKGTPAGASWRCDKKEIRIF